MPENRSPTTRLRDDDRHKGRVLDRRHPCADGTLRQMQGPWLLSQWEGKWTAGQHYGGESRKPKSRKTGRIKTAPSPTRRHKVLDGSLIPGIGFTLPQQQVKPNGNAMSSKVNSGRGERIRTSGHCLPKAVLYQAELHPEIRLDRFFNSRDRPRTVQERSRHPCNHTREDG